jgi:hypothetical protein
MAFDGRLLGHPEVAHPPEGGPLPREDWYYVYRWAVSPSHLSGRGDQAQQLYDEVGKLPVPAGRFQLRPAWKQDYVALTGARL